MGMEIDLKISVHFLIQAERERGRGRERRERRRGEEESKTLSDYFHETYFGDVNRSKIMAGLSGECFPITFLKLHL